MLSPPPDQSVSVNWCRHWPVPEKEFSGARGKSEPEDLAGQFLFDCRQGWYQIILHHRWDHPLSLLDAPSRQEMRGLIHEGELATWEKMEMVRNCTAISRTLYRILTARKF